MFQGWRARFQTLLGRSDSYHGCKNKMGRWQSGQLPVAVNHVSSDFGGSNPSRPTIYYGSIMVMHQAVNLVNRGSSPFCSAIISDSSKGRTADFDPANRGSNP